jgi:hypothetical protein
MTYAHCFGKGCLCSHYIPVVTSFPQMFPSCPYLGQQWIKLQQAWVDACLLFVTLHFH